MYLRDWNYTDLYAAGEEMRFSRVYYFVLEKDEKSITLTWEEFSSDWICAGYTVKDWFWTRR